MVHRHHVATLAANASTTLHTSRCSKSTTPTALRRPAMPL